MRVFIKTDDKNRVTAVDSELFISDTTGWTQIDEGDGDRFAHAQGNYLPKPLTDDNGIYRYKYADGAVMERSAEEMATEYNSKRLTEIKGDKIIESKNKLAEWLSTNPMEFTDGKLYSVTEEKQALLNGNLASYERATKAGVEYDLKWNSTGQPCESWNYDDLLTLSLSIAAYVAPKVAAQQFIEIAIKECDTIEEIENIVIDYE